ncbi:molecular chaperone, partial [Volvox carteri f. nagariensis]
AYRDAARRWHPDKGGSAAAFARVQDAWAVLGDSRRRATYDACAYDYLHQYMHQDRQRLLCAQTALEGAWGSHPLHWPLVVTRGSMLERLGRREMEAKRLEDDRRLTTSDPHHRTEAQLRELRSFNEAAALAAARHDHQVRYDPVLGRLYMWTQTEHHVVMACYLPNGRHDRAVQVEVRSGVLRLGPAGGLPVVHRALEGALDPEAPLEVHSKPRMSDDRRGAPMAWAWGNGGCAGGGGGSVAPSSWWRRLFVGDSDGARSLPPPYKLTQLSDEVVLEIALPWWVRAEDVTVDVEPRRMAVAVRGVGLHLERHYWWNSTEAARRPATYQPVVPELSSWSLSDEGGGGAPPRAAVAPAPSAAAAAASSSASPAVLQAARVVAAPAAAACHEPAARRRMGRCLTVSLALPELTEEEKSYKKGIRQDNRQALRGTLYSGPRTQAQQGRGVRFFQEDEDSFGLEPLLQAAMFGVRGGAWVVPPPWRHEEPVAVSPPASC